MARPCAACVPTPDERNGLDALAAGGDAALARAARIILLLADGVPGKEVARRLATSPQTVCAWRRRFLAGRLAAFGPGVPAAIAPVQSPADVTPQPATLERIATLVGVHRSTVHRILRRGGEGSPLAERVLAAARDLGYRPQPKDPARRAALHRFRPNAVRRQILFFLPEGAMRDRYFGRMAAGALDALSGTRFDALVRLSGDLAERLLPPAVARGEVAAVVSHDCDDWLEIQRAQIGRLPVAHRPALVGLLRPLAGTWCATIDFAAAAGALIDRLVALGHRRFIAIEERSVCTAGMRAALARHGLDPALALACANMAAARHDPAERMKRTLDGLLRRQPDATALLAANDPMALAACEGLAALGRPVPQAMSVAGFDGTHGEGFLASIAIPLEEVGRAAAQLAMEPGGEPRDLQVPWTLREGPSMGPAPR